MKLYTVHAINHRLYLHHVLGVVDSLDKAKEILKRNIHANDMLYDQKFQKVEYFDNPETLGNKSWLFNDDDVCYEIHETELNKDYSFKWTQAELPENYK